MRRQYPELPGWHFEVDELSAGIYRAIGRDSAGREVSAIGPDLEDQLGKCRSYAADVLRSGSPSMEYLASLEALLIAAVKEVAGEIQRSRLELVTEFIEHGEYGLAASELEALLEQEKHQPPAELLQAKALMTG